ncbi:hypothetical protein HK100_006360 [Physocladia obscura]|uniref:Helicase C-terminal domain-containing protein n=1 Tax=Physocladia obscura TaxID=109957 RepID=A0AAD5SQK9_9FUNG|nr:hypothetical protein HK100_006360 [Physocladia obscura]
MNCRLIRELKSYPSANRLILSGTPLQNNLTELWSLLNFLMPDIFESITDFESWFDFDDLGNNDTPKGIDKESSFSLVSSLHEILKPFLLRRIKTEVELDLPKKRELLLFAPLMPKQKELYDACVGGIQQFREYLIEKRDINNGTVAATSISTPEVANDESDGVDSVAASSSIAKVSTEALNGNEKDDSTSETRDDEEEQSEAPLKRRKSRRLESKASYNDAMDDDEYFDMIEEKGIAEASKKPATPEIASSRKIVQNQKLQNLLMQLRKICNHPYLFDLPDDDAEQDFDFHSNEVIPTGTDNNSNGTKNKNLAVRLPDIVACSGKMLMLERLLPELFKRGHKVLIFSQMTRMLDILADWFEFIKKWNFCRIDGNVTIETRREHIHEFNSNPDVRLFLLSTRSGGLGINLTSADTVIIFDSDWNPQMDLQAQDRVHRIGQTRPVIIYRLVTSGTVEKRILDRAASKRKLEKLVIHKSEFKGNSSYYKEKKKVADIEDLVAILELDNAESVTVGSLDSESTNGDNMVLMDKVISNDALEQILDRSPEAFLPKIGGRSEIGEGKNGGGGGLQPKFQEVLDERDESNDILSKMK